MQMAKHGFAADQFCSHSVISRRVVANISRSSADHGGARLPRWLVGGPSSLDHKIVTEIVCARSNKRSRKSVRDWRSRICVSSTAVAIRFAGTTGQHAVGNQDACRLAIRHLLAQLAVAQFVGFDPTAQRLVRRDLRPTHARRPIDDVPPTIGSGLSRMTARQRNVWISRLWLDDVGVDPRRSDIQAKQRVARH